MKRTVRSLQAPVGSLLQEGAAPGVLSTAAIATWRGLESTLVPLVGHRGYVALLGRSLHLVRQAHPWLPPGPGPSGAAGDLLMALQTALAGQAAGTCAAAHAAMVEAFCEVLASLIGGPLTERVLRPVGSPSGTAGDASP